MSENKLMNSTLRNRLRNSLAYDLCWKVMRPSILHKRRSEIEFYRALGIGQGDLIFDIGANHGAKTDIFLRLGAEVISVDPDEDNQRTLHQKFLSWRFYPQPVTVVGKAVSSDNRGCEFLIDTPGGAKNTVSRKWVDTLLRDNSRFHMDHSFNLTKWVPSVTLDELIAEHGTPKYIKIDVEGHELPAVRGLSQSVEMLSFEVNLPEFKQEGFEGIARLQALSPYSVFNYSADLSRGFALDKWVSITRFQSIFGQCKESSIEIFWRT